MENDFYTEDRVARPTFLTVLCILTFVGSSFRILSSGYSYINANQLSSFTSGMVKVKVSGDTTNINRRHSGPGNFFKKFANTASNMNMPQNLRKKAIGDFIGALFCLCGALFMWKLKRTGFYIYIAGIVIEASIPFYVFGNNFLTVFQVATVIFFGLLFIIFYAMNLKSMK